MSPRRQSLATRFIALSALGAAGVTAIAPGAAHAGTYTQTNETLSSWGSGAAVGHARAYVRAYSRDFACDLRDCATVRDLYGSVNGYKDGNNGQLPNATKMRIGAAFGGVNLSVGVSAGVSGAGGGLSFTDLGASCATDDVQNDGASISINAPGEVCHASTWGWVSNIDVTTSGMYRLDRTWTTVTAFDRVSVGGL